MTPLIDKAPDAIVYVVSVAVVHVKVYGPITPVYVPDACPPMVNVLLPLYNTSPLTFPIYDVTVYANGVVVA